MKRKPDSVFIIAEAGVNHNGCLRTARKLIDAAVVSGADAVKFQTFVPELLSSKYAHKAAYQKLTTAKDESQLEMLMKLAFGIKEHRELMRYCQRKKIGFLSSAFDLQSIDLLTSLGLQLFKIPSGEITNLPYLRKIGSLRKKIILSTGMANLGEIRDAVKVLLDSGTKKSEITVLHCNTEYPTPFEDVNLLAMLTIGDTLGMRVGYSDHTPGIEVAVAAVALGASVIEKHFTLDKNMPGPDHKASLDPVELKMMVCAVRNLETALGSGIKQPSKSEWRNISIVRKSIVAAKDIRKGEIFSPENITVKRPAAGLSPMQWDDVLGRRAKRDFRTDECLRI